jgi:hypothetical protein
MGNRQTHFSEMATSHAGERNGRRSAPGLALLSGSYPVTLSGCGFLVEVPEEESDLLLSGARVLINCSECNREFVGEPDKIWTFH